MANIIKQSDYDFYSRVIVGSSNFSTASGASGGVGGGGVGGGGGGGR
jgi:hypothetical protein